MHRIFELIQISVGTKCELEQVPTGVEWEIFLLKSIL